MIQEFFTQGGPIMILLGITSAVAVGFILDRIWCLRWNRIFPKPILKILDSSSPDSKTLQALCRQIPSALSRLLLDLEIRKGKHRQEIDNYLSHAIKMEQIRLERGLVVLEIVVGIAPLLGLIGSIHGLMILFGDFSQNELGDNAALARGIAVALNTTLAGLLISIPALIAFSYFNRKVEAMGVALEAYCEEWIQHEIPTSPASESQPET